MNQSITEDDALTATPSPERRKCYPSQEMNGSRVACKARFRYSNRSGSDTKSLVMETTTTPQERARKGIRGRSGGWASGRRADGVKMRANNPPPRTTVENRKQPKHKHTKIKQERQKTTVASYSDNSNSSNNSNINSNIINSNNSSSSSRSSSSSTINNSNTRPMYPVSRS